MKSQSIILFSVVLSCFFTCTSPDSEKADLVLINTKVWTGDPKVFAEAVAIQGNKIIQVGSTNEIKKFKSGNTLEIDAQGKLVIPGFNDAHIHFLSGSVGLTEVELSAAESLEEFAKLIKDFAAKNPAVPWITGRGWQYSSFPGGLPTKKFLDTLSIDRPIYLSAYDGHSSLANSKALELAGINRKTKFEGYGEIVRDASGEPTGVFTEHAESLIDNIIPPLSRDEKLDALRKGMKLAASLGITSIQNASGSIEEFSLYKQLHANNELTLRTSTAFSVGEGATKEKIDSFVKARDSVGSNPMLRVGAVKFMLDGVIESHTAAMLEQYSDADTKGKLSMPFEKYKELVTLCDKAGFQIYTHAIGDLAVREALNVYEEVKQTNSSGNTRHRIEHIEMVSSEDIPRFNLLGVMPSMEPIHAEPGTMEVWAKAVGEKRLPNSFAWAAMLKSQAQLVFSSDWPACISLDPIYGLHVAVTRCTPKGWPDGGWIPEQKISVQDALHAYTYMGSYASFEEKIKGKIAPGYLADLVILSQDLFAIDPLEIHKTKVLYTLFDGKIVYQAK